METDELAFLCIPLVHSRSNVGGRKFAEESSQWFLNLSIPTKM